MNLNEIEVLLEKQRNYFSSQHTKSISFRKKLLKALRIEVALREQEIYAALQQDFKKSQFETYLSEIGIVISELDLTISKLNSWARPKKVKSSLLNFPSSDRIYSDPYGSVLIIAPWNYPFQLAISPLIGAIAAGNTVIVKPSELTPKTSNLIASIIEKVFEKEHVAVVEGGRDVSQNLLKMHWDYIFFTGSVQVGKIVAKAAAEHLTPVTLELGGKNPCIIDETANIKLAAKRIAWGKLLNAGQTCIAPDYILIKESIKQSFIDQLILEIEKAYSQNPEFSSDYPRIINEKNFKRLKMLLSDENIVYGGQVNDEDLYISPTIVESPDVTNELMKDEIFGPILPVLAFKDHADLERVILRYNKPLSLYVFSSNKNFITKILDTFSFGGGAINDVMVQFANHRLPFGGVGHSGIGAYHGKATFDTFSHKKAITKRANWIDPPFRYAPYKGKLSLIKKILRLLG
ncbi:MAG: aldehyde dehydrogenase [Bacteroidia bacterium]|nr:aldehyde dehydrogenase [Bacteroidia bacterium]NND09957.1 aldehyde dehydrogenase [Flavobacteriaceae bacterium]NNK27508.1 aldehyde dehydrogenase [Flavobacteriaceae bacterium]RZV66930.1 MAG: aldehyde dehydrogenase [Flavobacteriaceae bacterium]